MKYVLKARDDAPGTVIDGDTLHRFIDEARAADAGDRDALAVLPATALYVAERLAALVDYGD